MTHRKMPSTTSQNFMSATYEREKTPSIRSQFPEAALKLYARSSLYTTAGSWKLTILIGEILGERKRYWIGKQWFIRELIHAYIGLLALGCGAYDTTLLNGEMPARSVI